MLLYLLYPISSVFVPRFLCSKHGFTRLSGFNYGLSVSTWHHPCTAVARPVLRAADVTLGRGKGGVLHLRHLTLQLAEGRLGLTPRSGGCSEGSALINLIQGGNGEAVCES